MQFGNFPEISYILKILCLKLFSSSQSNSYLSFLLLTTTLRFSYDERKICKLKCLKILHISKLLFAF